MFLASMDQGFGNRQSTKHQKFYNGRRRGSIVKMANHPLYKAFDLSLSRYSMLEPPKLMLKRALACKVVKTKFWEQFANVQIW